MSSQIESGHRLNGETRDEFNIRLPLGLINCNSMIVDSFVSLKKKSSKERGIKKRDKLGKKNKNM